MYKYLWIKLCPTAALALMHTFYCTMSTYTVSTDNNDVSRIDGITLVDGMKCADCVAAVCAESGSVYLQRAGLQSGSLPERARTQLPHLPQPRGLW